MKKIEDYLGTKTAIKCENAEQWERLKELCRGRLNYSYKFNELDGIYFMLNLNNVGNSFSEKYSAISEFTILPFSDFVSTVPELKGVEMTVSDDGETWETDIVFGTYNGKFIGFEFTTSYARPIQPKKVITATLEELAEMLNVDEIKLK